MNRFLLWGLVLMALVMLVSPVAAQNAFAQLTERYESEDGTFAFYYPTEWTVDDTQRYVSMTSPVTDGAVLIVQFIGPETIGLFAPGAASALDALESSATVLSTLITGEAQNTPLGDRDVAAAEMKNDSIEGIAIMVAFEGGDYGLMMAFTPQSGKLRDFLTTITQIAMSYNTPEASSASGTSASATEVPAVPLTETYTGENNQYVFMYPADWTINTDEKFVRLISPLEGDTFLLVSFLDPELVSSFAPDPTDVLDAMSMAKETFSLITGSPTESASGGRPTAIAPINTDESEGFAFMIEFDTDQYGLMVAVTQVGQARNYFQVIIDLAASFGLPGQQTGLDTGGLTGVTVTSTPVVEVAGGLPKTLTSYDGEWNEAIAELQDLKLISFGGSLVFQENSAFFSGQGNFFTPLASRSPYSDIVMAGELTFTLGDTSQFESCSLVARINTDSRGSATSFVDIAFITDGVLLIQDLFSTSADPNRTVAPVELDFGSPHHILVLLQDTTMHVYVDGELAVENFEVADRAGTYGIALRGKGAGARCEGRNIWVYQVPAFKAGVCEISAPNNVNKRSGPGTTFDRAGQLNAGQLVLATGQADGGDGFTWWRLDDDTWVREDVVNAQGDCAGLPEVSG